MAGIVAIIGRPNAGKSSLFNRLTGTKNAIVDDMPGVTRDRLYGECEHMDRNFYVIDTGGIFGTDTEFSAGIKNHVDEAVKECDLIIFLLDGHDGVTSSDEEIADFIRKASGNNKPVIVAMNKLDDPKHDDLVNDAYSLGFENVISISALHKRGIDELLDLVVEFLPDDYEEFEENPDEIRLVIAGKPNVGKSSLLNKITNSERSLVSPIAGTTRDGTIEAATEALREYLKDLVMNTTDTTDIIVRLSAVGAIISSLPQILDYSELKINGDTENIEPGEDNVPIIGEVDINVLQ